MPNQDNQMMPGQDRNAMPYYGRSFMPSSYPEVYYRIQPYIIAAADEMESYGPDMPSQDIVEKMSDSIYDDMNSMYPDIADYIKDHEAQSTINPIGFPSHFRPRFRRRGLFRDFIDILLLSELANRRRRHNYYY